MGWTEEWRRSNGLKNTYCYLWADSYSLTNHDIQPFSDSTVLVHLNPHHPKAHYIRMDLLLHLQHPFHPPQSLLLVLLSEQNLRNRRGPLGGGPEDHGASNDGAVIGGSKNRKNRAHCRFCPVIPRWGAVCGPTKKTLLFRNLIRNAYNDSGSVSIY